MSLSVDDLVASFSNNHIGQEAIDLAALQAQLAQVIFAQQSGLSLKPTKQVRPCNTPTSATLPCSWNRISPIDDIESQDERMVEELLIPATQAQQTHYQTHSQNPTFDPASFTSTDPFYMAQMQQETQRQAGAYARFGLPDERSPFMVGAHMQ